MTHNQTFCKVTLHCCSSVFIKEQILMQFLRKLSFGQSNDKFNLSPFPLLAASKCQTTESFVDFLPQTLLTFRSKCISEIWTLMIFRKSELKREKIKKNQSTKHETLTSCQVINPMELIIKWSWRWSWTLISPNILCWLFNLPPSQHCGRQHPNPATVSPSFSFHSLLLFFPLSIPFSPSLRNSFLLTFVTVSPVSNNQQKYLRSLYPYSLHEQPSVLPASVSSA